MSLRTSHLNIQDAVATLQRAATTGGATPSTGRRATGRITAVATVPGFYSVRLATDGTVAESITARTARTEVVFGVGDVVDLVWDSAQQDIPFIMTGGGGSGSRVIILLVPGYGIIAR